MHHISIMFLMLVLTVYVVAQRQTACAYWMMNWARRLPRCLVKGRTIELKLYIAEETPVQDIQTALRTPSHRVTCSTWKKSIFVQLVRSSTHAADKRPTTSRPSRSVGNNKGCDACAQGHQVKEMLRELEEIKIVEKGDGTSSCRRSRGRARAPRQSAREGHLEDKALEAVYKTICDHNNYMRSQLEQYKAYLQNVRLTRRRTRSTTA